MTVYNFTAGPAMLPKPVMEQAAEEFFNWGGRGYSVMEVSHRSADFRSLAEESEQDFRDLLGVPAHYKVLFLAGGAQTQFATVPMNLLGDLKCAAYVKTGHWGEKAIIESSRYASMRVVADAKPSGFTTIPEESSWDDYQDAAYLHYVDNETIQGVEFPFIPSSQDVPLVCDMSSNLLSRPFDVEKFGVIYACAQKTLSIAGVTIVCVDEALFDRKPFVQLPNTLNYAIQAEKGSMYNTPPTYPWYLASLVFKWVKSQGGVPEMAHRARQKSQKLYEYIDQEDFYENRVEKSVRSRMNVPFFLPTKELDLMFAAESAKSGLIGLKGHRVVGGARASIYNAMPEEGVDVLIDFMKDFAKRYG